MTENQLNDNKTKLFSFPFLLPWNLPPFPFLTRLLLALITSPSLILPGTLDSFLTQNCPCRSTSLKPVRLVFLEPKCISSIHSFLTADAAKIVVTSYNYILSGRDYCSYLLMGTPDSVIQPLPENSKFCHKTCSLDTLSPPLYTWLPISVIKYKVTNMCFSAINRSGPAYLSELLHVYTLSCTLRSSSDTCILKCRWKTHVFRIFPCFGPYIWNSLPQDLWLFNLVIF